MNTEVKKKSMTQKQKELLLNDLCARLPYKVYAQIPDEYGGYTSAIESIDIDGFVKDSEGTQIEIENIKPYLFPLSSMSDEQWMDTPYANLNNFTFDSFKCGCSTLAFETYEVNLNYVVEFINWCYKNHFDINGLIPMGLAIDATGKNIY